jgi:hypothetical protein
MTTLNTGHSEVRSINPVDLAEDLAGANDWAVERQGDNELTMFISGHYTDMQFRVLWREDFKTLQYACLFDLKVPEGRESDIYQTIGLINERMWIGHFEYWAEEKALLYRHASLSGDPMVGEIGEDHLVTMVETALGECERFYPVFQFVMWGGQSPAEAIEAAMLECVGSA